MPFFGYFLGAIIFSLVETPQDIKTSGIGTRANNKQRNLISLNFFNSTFCSQYASVNHVWFYGARIIIGVLGKLVSANILWNLNYYNRLRLAPAQDTSGGMEKMPSFVKFIILQVKIAIFPKKLHALIIFLICVQEILPSTSRRFIIKCCGKYSCTYGLNTRKKNITITG